jgi:hypothetical protein
VQISLTKHLTVSAVDKMHSYILPYWYIKLLHLILIKCLTYQISYVCVQTHYSDAA